MKKILSIILSLAILLAQPAMAEEQARISLASGETSYTVGQTISVTVSVNPKGSAYDTVMAYGNFPASRLQIESITPDPLLSALSPDNGYDNSAGTFSFGGGIAGGTNAPANLATIVFKVIGEGNVAVSLNSDSAIVNAGNTVPAQTNSSIVFALSAVQQPKPVEKPAPKPAPAKPAKTPVQTIADSSSAKQLPDEATMASSQTAGLSIPLANAQQNENYSPYYTYILQWGIIAFLGAAAIAAMAFYIKKRKIKKFEDEFKI